MRRNFLQHGFISTVRALALAACGGSGYNGGGSPQSSPGAGGPASVYNATSDFVVPGVVPVPPLTAAASFIFSGEGGTIAAWTIGDLTNAMTVYDDGAGGAVYKGLANANNGKANFLYATDFHNNKVD